MGGSSEGAGELRQGRNRREVCRRASVEPTTVELDGQDPVRYILSANINRRHLTKSQRAMAVAKLFPEPEKGGRGKNSVLNYRLFSGASFSRPHRVEVDARAGRSRARWHETAQ